MSDTINKPLAIPINAAENNVDQGVVASIDQGVVASIDQSVVASANQDLRPRTTTLRPRTCCGAYDSVDQGAVFSTVTNATSSPAIKFGTDGWRAIIGEDFNTANLARLAEATAKVYRQDNPIAKTTNTPILNVPTPNVPDTSSTSNANTPTPNTPVPNTPNPTPNPSNTPTPNTLIVGYDCRENAGRYAVLAATILASYGFEVLVSNSYCPTPTLCWSVDRNPQAVGGLMLTSSHNPAEYLGLKLRMPDGGASPKAFTDRVEAELTNALPDAYADALVLAEAAGNGTPEANANILAFKDTQTAPSFSYADLMTPYLNNLSAMVDAKVIAAAKLRVVVDPMFGAGRQYLAQTLRNLGVEVAEVNNANDPTFNGLHPEPILPWIKTGLDKVVELGYDAVFITDGDADRIGAGDDKGDFVNPHRILALVIALLVEDKGQRGRVVRTLSGSNLLKRQCERLNLELTTTPIGFKWIYEQMLAGDVMIGGEESGGIGIPSNVRERDGLLMTLLLVELMAQKQKTLGQLVAELLETLGNLDYARRDLGLTQAEKDGFLSNHLSTQHNAAFYQPLFVGVGEQIIHLDYRDGIKFDFASDAWLLARPSGTEPLVRIYAEAATPQQVENLLDIGCAIAKGQ